MEWETRNLLLEDSSSYLHWAKGTEVPTKETEDQAECLGLTSRECGAMPGILSPTNQA